MEMNPNTNNGGMNANQLLELIHTLQGNNGQQQQQQQPSVQAVAAAPAQRPDEEDPVVKAIRLVLAQSKAETQDTKPVATLQVTAGPQAEPPPASEAAFTLDYVQGLLQNQQSQPLQTQAQLRAPSSSFLQGPTNGSIQAQAADASDTGLSHDMVLNLLRTNGINTTGAQAQAQPQPDAKPPAKDPAGASQPAQALQASVSNRNGVILAQLRDQQARQQLAPQSIGLQLPNTNNGTTGTAVGNDLVVALLASANANPTPNAGASAGAAAQINALLGGSTAATAPAAANSQDERIKLLLVMDHLQTERRNAANTQAQQRAVLIQTLQQQQDNDISQLSQLLTGTPSVAPAAVPPQDNSLALNAICQQLGIQVQLPQPTPAAALAPQNQLLAALQSHQQNAAQASSLIQAFPNEDALTAALQTLLPSAVASTGASQAQTTSASAPSAVSSLPQPVTIPNTATSASTAPAGETNQQLKRGRAVKFPKTLHTILLQLGQDGRGIAGFTPDGMAFVIPKPDEFAKEILPEHFKMSSFSSFQRQINLYDFERVKGELDICYKHALFQRDRPELCVNMRRTKRKNKRPAYSAYAAS